MKTMMKHLFAAAFLFAAVSAFSEEETVDFTPHGIPGTPQAYNNNPTEGYGSSAVQAHIRVDLKDSEEAVHFIRGNTDPFVVTKMYELKHTNPYTIRGYILGVVNATQIAGNPVHVDAVRYNDGRGIVLVSAEDYRFENRGKGDSIDEIIAGLDQPGMELITGKGLFLYFPKANSAANLRDMILKVGATTEDVEFSHGVDKAVVDGGLNALFIASSYWSWHGIKEQLESYDKPMPEIRLSYCLYEVSAENDDKLGVDFQSWKNNDGIDFFSVGGRYRNNWARTFAGGIDGSHSSRTDFFNFNPKWNTKYFDFLTSTGRAKVVTQGVIAAKNRRKSEISVGSGLFYEEEDPIEDTSINKSVVIDGKPKLPDGADLPLEHGNRQNTKASEGFKFSMEVTPVVAGKASVLPIKVSGVSLLGWNSDGTPRLSKSEFETEIHLGYEARDIVIGGIKRRQIVRSVSGIPLLKDIPILGWAFSTESESARETELILSVHAEFAQPSDSAPEELKKQMKDVDDALTHGIEHPVANLGFEQLGLDSDKIE
jgi:type II secretory pathway component GspD/PulD (secretin)